MFFYCSSFTLYLRLFIVMGVTWSMEVISFFISKDAEYFLLTDICNTIQGVLIFFLFVLKRRVLRLIKKRFVLNGCFVSDRHTFTSFLSSHLLIALLFSVLKFRWQIFFGKAIVNGSTATNSTSATFRTSNLRLNQITTATDPKKESR